MPKITWTPGRDLKFAVMFMVGLFLCFGSSHAMVEDKTQTSPPNRVLFKLKPSQAGLRSDQTQRPALNQLIQKRTSLSKSKMEPVFRSRPVTKHSTEKLKQAHPPKDYGFERVMKLKTGSGEDASKLCQEIMATGEVEYCEPDFIVSIQTLPNDTYVDPDQNGVWAKGAWGQDPNNALHPDDLWGLKKIKAVEAWNVPGSTKGEHVVVAVIDTGVDYRHEDLTEDINANGILNAGEDQNGNGILDSNIWINTAEIPNNNIDDDGNGYIDDVRGWDFITFDGTPEDNDPMDDHGHGTHVSGTIAALTGNNKGIAGVAPKAKMMALKGLNANGNGSTDDLANAILYAADNGAQVINASWGGEGPTPQILIDVIQYAHDVKDVVFVAAAGNNNKIVQDTPGDGFFPANIHDVITVSAFNSRDQKAAFSNYGPKIDIAAPGGGDVEPASVYERIRSILSLKSALAGSGMTGNNQLIVGTKYLRQAGTSMAAPHASGLAALIRAQHPEYSAEQVRQVLRASSDDIGTPGFDIYSGYGRINALGASQTVHPATVNITSPVFSQIITGVDQISISGTAAGSNLALWRLEYGGGESPSAWTQIASGSQSITDGLIADWNITEVGEGAYTLRLTAQNADGKIFEDRILIHIDQFVISEPALIPVHFFRSGDSLVIKGTVNTADFQNYSIKVSKYVNGNLTEVSSADVTLTNGGLQKVRNDVLGVWNTANIPAGFYSIEVRVNHGGGWSSKEVKVGVDPTLHEGWPKTVDSFSEQGAASGITGSLNAADIDGNGTQDLIFASGGSVFIMNAADGQMLPGWPQSADGGSGRNIQASPVVGDVDGDGSPEVIAGNEEGTLFGWHSDGRPLDGWPKHKYGSINAPISLSLEDFSGTEINEIIAVTKDASVDVFGVPGTSFPGWPKQLTSSGALSPVVTGDLNHDGIMEIVVANLIDMNSYDFILHVLEPDGSYLAGWPKLIETGYAGNHRAYPVLADMDGDQNLEIIIPGAFGSVYAFHHDGTRVAGWPQPTRSIPLSTIAVGDIDGDYWPEIIAGTHSYISPDQANINFSLYAWHGDGSLVSGWPIQKGWSIESNGYIQKNGGGFVGPIIADINQDGKSDVIVAAGTFSPVSDPFGLYAFQYDGSVITGFPKYTAGVSGSPEAAPIVGDLNGDGSLDLAWFDAWYYNNSDPDNPTSGSYLYAWDLVAPSNALKPWPMFMHDPRHTGRYKLPPSSSLEISSFFPADLNPSTDEGGQIEFLVLANGPDQNTLTYEWKLDDAIQPIPSSTSNSWTYSPDFDAAGSHQIEVIISDGRGESISQMWSAQVQNVNRPPEISRINIAINHWSSTSSLTNPAHVTMKEGEVLTETPQTGDEDQDTLSFTCTLQMPDNTSVPCIDAGAFSPSFNDATGVLMLVPNFNSAGDYQVTLEVTDGQSGTDQRIFTITVQDKPAPTCSP